MSGGSQKQTTEPWSGAKPYFSDLYKSAQGAFDSSKTSYDAPLYAGPNQTQKDALAGVQKQAPGYEAAGQQALGLAQDTASGKYMDPNSNPWLKASVDAGTRGVMQDWQRNIKPTIDSAALQAGGYGGDRWGIAQGVAMGDAMNHAQDLASQMYGQNYQQERGYQQNATQQLAAALGLGMQGQQIMGQTGDQMQNWDQAGLDADLQKFQMDQQLPWYRLSQMSGILNGGGYNSQTMTNTVPRSTSMFQGAGSGAILGYGAGQQAGMDPRMSAIIGGLMGGAAGY